VNLTGAALTLGGALVSGVAALWAGLLALGEEAAVGEALHTLGDAPTTVGGRVPLHRGLYVARLALLVLGAVAAGDVLDWWRRPWAEAPGVWRVSRRSSPRWLCRWPAARSHLSVHSSGCSDGSTEDCIVS